MVNCKKLFAGSSQHSNGGEGVMKSVSRIRIVPGILDVTVSRVSSKIVAASFHRFVRQKQIFTYITTQQVAGYSHRKERQE